MSATTIEVVGLWKVYGDQAAVADVSFSVGAGEFFSLLGPSGCGKTTTLRAIAGFVEPDDGEIRIQGEDVIGTAPNHRQVNTVFQSYALFPHLTVRDNVGFGLREARRPRDEMRTRVAEALELVQLGHLADRRPRQLSGGQQQRVALARALINRPAALLLDEPMGALDLKLRRQMQLELKTIQRDVQISFIHVTHDQEEALTMSDRIGIMSDGRLLQSGTPSDVYERPVSRFVADFVGTTSFLPGRLQDETTFRFDGGSAAEVTSVAAGASGDCLLCLRPEAVQMHEQRPSGPNAVPAEVREVLYEGSSISYVLALPTGTDLLASRQNRPDGAGPRIEPGASVWAAWDAQAGRVVAAD